jgi:hypothetical protein
MKNPKVFKIKDLSLGFVIDSDENAKARHLPGFGFALS